MRKGIRSLSGLNTSGGAVNVPTPNPPSPPVTPPVGQQTINTTVVGSAPTVFAPTITKSSSTQNLAMAFVTSPSTVLAPTVSTNMITEPFTGTSGQPQSALWFAATTGTGSTLDLNNNQLRMLGGTQGNYADIQYVGSKFNAGNFSMTLDTTLVQVTEHYAHIGFRGSGTEEPTTDRAKQTAGYFVEIGPASSYIALYSRAATLDTLLGSVNLTFVAGDVVHLRIDAIGARLQVYVWRNAETVPLTAVIDTSDSAYTTGKVWLGHTGGVDTIPDEIRYDNLNINFNVVNPPDPGGSYLDPPTAEAIAGMNATPSFDESFVNFNNWYVYDRADGPNAVNHNGERSGLKRANAVIVSEAGTVGGTFARLICKRESYMGYSYTGVQMESAAQRFGGGAPFYVEVRLRWLGYTGAWVGPWMYDELNPNPYEVDIMETVNNSAARYALHSPNSGPTGYAGAPTPDNQWHRYGLRFDATGVKVFYDNVKVGTLGAGLSSFINAQMLMKIQHLCGGSYPDGEAGFTTPVDAQPFTDKNFDVDYYRVYVQAAGGGGGGAGTTRQVPAQGSLQAVADISQPGDTIVVSGVVTTTGKILDLKNRDNGGNPITIIGNPGNILRGDTSGIEGYGSCRGWTFQNLNVEVNGNAFFGEGFYFGGMRTDQGGNGLGASDIRILGCTVRPISGTGTVQRNGIAVWGADVVEISNCDVANVGYNDLGFPGGAGSGISCGESISSPRPSLANGTRFWIHNNKIRNVIGPGTGSFDRNGIILDLFLGSPGNALNANRIHGAVLIDSNDIANCEGRGIQLLVAGTDDVPVTVTNNLVTGSIGTNLAGSEPIAAIGGYGDGRCGNIICSTNTVSISSGVAAYKFISFDASLPSNIAGVRGTGNVGTPKVFVNSPTNTVPAGF